jgi:hypothetical protein
LDKFAPRSEKCLFIGYPQGQKGWKVFNLETHEFIVSRDVIFYEHIFPYASPNERMCEVQNEQRFNIVSQQDDEEETMLQDHIIEIERTPIHDATDEGAEESSGERAEVQSEGVTQNIIEISSGEEEVQSEGETQNVLEETELPPRTRQPSVRLKDHYCHAANINPSCKTSNSISSLGKVYPISNFNSFIYYSQKHLAYLAALTSNEEPTSYSQAMKHHEWREAMAKELKALEENETWELTTLPKGRKAVGCKWVYKIKYKANGEIEKYKARLVAKGFTQVEGEDYGETFAPVAKMTTIRCLLTVAVARGWELHQMDVSNAFLHGELDEEVYMNIPQGYKALKEGLVGRLKKSLYGLKQASRNWYFKLSQALLSYSFKECQADHSLFTYTDGSTFIAILVYVDDLVIAGNDSFDCAKFKEYLSNCFHMKDLSVLKYFLGLELARGSSGMFMCQQKYTLDILDECGMLACKPSNFPMEQNHRLALATGPSFSDPSKYRRLVGRLI